MTSTDRHRNSAVQRRQVDLEDKEVVIFDLLRIDETSLAELETQLESEAFDAVAVELDELRRPWLEQRDHPDDLNLVDIFKSGQGSRLGGYLALQILQKRLNSFSEGDPGDDVRLAMRHCDKRNRRLHFIDRDAEITGLRAWRHASRWQRFRMALAFAIGPFRRTRRRDDAEDPQKLAQRIETLERSLPTVATAFLEERNTYMAGRIAAVKADRLAVVVGTPHADELRRRLENCELPSDPQRLEEVPDKTLFSRLLPWLISVIIVLFFAGGFYFGDTETLQNMALTWALINTIITALATTAALAHPAAVAAAALSAPLVSLNPTMGAGFVGAAVQSILVPPGLAEVEGLGDDIARLRGWWQNRLARLALIFVFANLGSTIATFVAFAVLPGMMG